MFTLPEGITSTAPEYEPLPPGPVRPSIVSLFGPDGTGIRLRETPRGLGYGLAAGATGLGPAPVENTTAPLGSGGVVLRHQRITESTVVLPIKLHAQSGRELRRMIAQLTKILTPGEGFATIAVYSPYSNESRYARVLYDSGLDEPQWDGPLSEKFTVVLERIDPFWVGEIRGEDYEVQPSIKPYITKYEGEPDPDGPPAVTYSWEGAPHASSSVKRVDGETVARNLVPSPWRIDSSYSTSNVEIEQADNDSLNLVTTTGGGTSYTGKTRFDVEPGQWFASAASFEWGEGIGRVRHQVQFRGPDNESIDAPQQQSDRSDHPDGGRTTAAWEVPDGATEARLYTWYYLEGTFTTAPAGSTIYVGKYSVAVAGTEEDALAQVEEYFDGDTPNELHRKGAYEFPFIPMFLSDSTIQGELDIVVEGDAPTYPTFTIRGPGEDPQFFFDGGKELFIPGVIDSNITIVTEPQFQDVFDESGPLWERIPKTRAAMEPLRPGRNTIKFSMVGASVQSLIRIEYREQWRGAH